ncbi:MAG TPA: hypothetical protein GXX70_01650 [Tepidimicrobium sp.]|nr:hypothetical protein [Tepidimicrobium sp.]
MKMKGSIVYNRIFKMLFLSTLIFAFLVVRLYWIQIVNHESLRAEALKQRGQEIRLSPNRGIIYDRNLIPLTNRKKVITGFFFKKDIESDSTLREAIIKSSHMDDSQLDEHIKSKGTIVDIPLISNLLDIDERKFFTANRIERYDDINMLSHVIGHINRSENKGEAGIEKVYDEILKNEGDHSVYIDLDERRRIFTKEEYLVNRDIDPRGPNGVKLTVDYYIQKEVERILDRRGIKGSAIVADVKTGDILAMASRPNFDQDNIERYLNREDMALYNKAVQVGYPPGSLFKLVVLLTAFEKGDHNFSNQFYCNGYERVGKSIINCNKREGHGHITLREAFSKSCNSAFIQLGQEVGSKNIIDMANRLGFGSRLNIGLLEEIEGNLPTGSELLGPAIGNISIGQGSIEVTPLQVTNMMLSIANGGIKKGMAIVKGTVGRDGYMIKGFNRSEDFRVISEKTAKIIKGYLADVVQYGTANNLDLTDIGGAGGKTGSAEAILNGRRTVHGWFSGFYPLENPKHVVTVFVEEGMSGSQTAVPIFEDITRTIYNIKQIGLAPQ